MGHVDQIGLDLLLLDSQWRQRGEIEAHVQGCPQCAERLQAMREHAHDFAQNRFVRSSGHVRSRLQRRPWFVLAPVILAAAAALVVFVNEPYVGTKGAATVRFALGPQGAMKRVSGSVKAHPGDALAFVTEGAAGKELLVVAVRDGEPPQVYAPFEGTTSMHVNRDGQVADAIAVDGKPERIFAIISTTPLRASNLKLGAEVPDDATVIELDVEAAE